MDKLEFVREAPRYYALAIASELLDQGRIISKQFIRKKYTVSDENGFDGNFCLVEQDLLWDAAIEWLIQQEMVIVSKGSFGPPLYSQSDQFEKRWQILLKTESPFSHYSIVDDRWDWLVAALYDVSNEFHALKISREDFKNPVDEWQPIQLDPEDPELKNAIAKLSTAVEEIRKDNGYAASQPQEREFVLKGLAGTLENLESHSVVPGYLRDAFAKLQLVGRRFIGGTLEAAIVGAKQAIIELVKKKGGDLLQALIGLFS